MQNRAELARIQMPPLALGLMIVKRAGLAKVRAWPLQPRAVLQINMNFSRSHVQFNVFDTPRSSDAKNGGV